MKIEKINDNKIKVTINEEDIKIWNVSYEKLTDNTPEARDLFWFALRLAEKDVNFKVGSSKLFVEVHSQSNNGFVMFISKAKAEEISLDYITGLKKERRTKGDFRVFLFECFDDLCNCVEIIKGNFVGESSLYKYNEKFYLWTAPYNIDEFLENESIFLEYSVKVKCSGTFRGTLREYGTEMIKENAVEIISGYFV